MWLLIRWVRFVDLQNDYILKGPSNKICIALKHESELTSQPSCHCAHFDNKSCKDLCPKWWWKFGIFLMFKFLYEWIFMSKYVFGNCLGDVVGCQVNSGASNGKWKYNVFFSGLINWIPLMIQYKQHHHLTGKIQIFKKPILLWIYQKFLYADMFACVH